MTEPDDYDVLVGKNIRALRTARGLTQEQLATEVAARGVPFRQQTIVKIESGRRPLRLREADAIADALEVDVDALVDDPPTLDVTALVITHTRGVWEAWGEIESATRSMIERLRYLQGALDMAGRKTEPTVSQHVLNDAATALQSDPEKIVRGTLQKIAAEAEVLNAEYDMGVRNVVYKRDGEEVADG